MAQFGDVVQEFASRGLIHDSTDRAELTKRSTSSQMSAYVGFDPTSDSLHVGNLLGQISLRRFQMLGHRPVVLAGGATGMVGDPSGRSEERNLLDSDTLAHNPVRSRATTCCPPPGLRIFDSSKPATISPCCPASITQAPQICSTRCLRTMAEPMKSPCTGLPKARSVWPLGPCGNRRSRSRFQVGG